MSRLNKFLENTQIALHQNNQRTFGGYSSLKKSYKHKSPTKRTHKSPYKSPYKKLHRSPQKKSYRSPHQRLMAVEFKETINIEELLEFEPQNKQEALKVMTGLASSGQLCEDQALFLSLHFGPPGVGWMDPNKKKRKAARELLVKDMADKDEEVCWWDGKMYPVKNSLYIVQRFYYLIDKFFSKPGDWSGLYEDWKMIREILNPLTIN